MQRQIDQVEQEMIKGLKNKLNEDNKKSQSHLSILKKNYEDFLQQYEKLTKQFQNSSQHLQKLHDQFEDNEFERMNIIHEIQNKL